MVEANAKTAGSKKAQDVHKAALSGTGFVNENTGNIKDFYKISSCIGRGKCGCPGITWTLEDLSVQVPTVKYESVYTRRRRRYVLSRS